MVHGKSSNGLNNSATLTKSFYQQHDVDYCGITISTYSKEKDDVVY